MNSFESTSTQEYHPELTTLPSIIQHEFDECAPLAIPPLEPGSPNFIFINAGWGIALFCAFLSTALSLYLIYKHLQYYTKPFYQKWIIRILLMVPIYAFCSSLSFRFYYYSIYFDIIRDVYEAFVIYSFYALLISYMGRDLNERHQFLHGKPRMTLPFPLNCFKFSPHGQAFLINTKILCLQYVVIRPLMTLLAIILSFANVLCPLSRSFAHGQMWITSINLISVCVATYALILMYIVIHHDIKHHQPFYKVNGKNH
jgi:hypothetical protein